MLDPLVCQNVQTQARSQIGLLALQQLRQLLDGQNADGSDGEHGMNRIVADTWIALLTVSIVLSTGSLVAQFAEILFGLRAPWRPD